MIYLKGRRKILFTENLFMGFIAETFEFLQQKSANLLVWYGVRDNDKGDLRLATKIFLDQVAVLLVLEFITGILVHKRVVLIVLGTIVFDRQFQVWVVEVQFQVFTCDGVLEEIGADLVKRLLEIKFRKILAHLFPFAATIARQLLLSSVPWGAATGGVDRPEQCP
jgi:hypothetical protein